MSMDYPDYLRIKARSRWLALVWRVGDCAYYLGLLGGVMAFAFAVVTFVVVGSAKLFGGGQDLERFWRLLPACAVAVPVGTAIFFAGASLKAFARRRAGISDDEFRA